MLKSAGKLDCLFIDYLGEIINDSEAYASTNANVKAIRDIARDLDIPVILGSQLSRKPEDRKGSKNDADHMPRLSDLRDSGKIEEVARNVWMLYRPEYYDKTKDPTDLRLIVAKASHGTVGMVGLNIDLPHMSVGQTYEFEGGNRDGY
jgi:replicative DNA helicase